MGSTAEHQALVHSILKEYGALPHLRMWKNATGTAKSHDGNRFINFGLKGSADILGIMRPSGQFLAIEVKTGNAKQNKNQQSFQRMIEEFGGKYILCRNLSDCKILLNR